MAFLWTEKFVLCVFQHIIEKQWENYYTDAQIIKHCALNKHVKLKRNIKLNTVKLWKMND